MTELATAVNHAASPPSRATPRVPLGQIRYTLAGSLADAPAQWDDLVPRGGPGFYATRAWHLANGDLTGADGQGIVLAWEGGTKRPRLRAVVPSYQYAGQPPLPLLDPSYLFGSMLKGSRFARTAAWGQVTLIGNTVGYETAPICHPDDENVWVQAVRRAMPKHGTCAILHLDGGTAARLAHHFPNAPLLLSYARTALRVQGATLEDHLSFLARSQRRLSEREVRRLDEGRRTISIAPLTSDLIPDLVRLRAATERGNGPGPEVEAEFYRYAKSSLADTAQVVLCHHDGRVIGYHLAFQHGDTLVSRGVGLDYPQVGGFAEYACLLAHIPVRVCLARRLHEIDFGLGAFPQKLMRGARMIPLWSLLLRPPHGWTPRHTREVNRRRAAALFDEHAPHMDVDDIAVFQVIAQTGMFAI